LKGSLFPDANHLDLDVFNQYIETKYHFNFFVGMRDDTLSEEKMTEIRQIDASMRIRIGYVGGSDGDQGCSEGDAALIEMNEILKKFYKIDGNDCLFDYPDDEYRTGLIFYIPKKRD
jgi:hypothetical protein